MTRSTTTQSAKTTQKCGRYAAARRNINFFLAQFIIANIKVCGGKQWDQSTSQVFGLDERARAFQEYSKHK